MFKPSVPVIDGHAVLGRRHDRRVAFDTPGDLIAVMDRNGIERALVYHRYAVEYDTQAGNAELESLVSGYPRLIAQRIVNMASDDRARFYQSGSRSLRVFPKSHLYPFVPWVVGPWMDWIRETGKSLWVSVDEVDPRDLYETAHTFPTVPFVLSAVHYGHFAFVWPLIAALPNLYIELSRLDIMVGVRMFVKRIGPGRLLFGSFYPELDPGPYLFYLHRTGLDDDALRAICRDTVLTLVEDDGAHAI
ncbi:MAG: amidohydrolase family protein [candidate division Zixibacteria bacterium]|nr:amidohydrolase family protein [candidate division Zixibacteria bacterium]